MDIIINSFSNFQVRPKIKYKPITSKFDGVTTVMADFKPHKNAKRAPSFKPPNVYVKSTVPFDGRTVQSTVYRAWPVVKPEKPEWGKRPKYVPPIRSFATNSSYKVKMIEFNILQCCWYNQPAFSYCGP
jgi:hypothetical protein